MKVFENYQHGINLGGWISQRPNVDKKHYDEFITEADIQQIASWGLDHVRLPMDCDVLVEKNGFHYVDQCISWCERADLRIILDLHKTFGYSFAGDADMTRFFYDEGLQEQFFALWEEIAKRYGDRPERVSFELLNEVVVADVADAWNAIIRKAIARIRNYAPKTFILVGGVCYNAVTKVALLDPPVDDHIVYNFHCYDPHTFTHQAARFIDLMPKDFTMNYPMEMTAFREKSAFFPRDPEVMALEEKIPVMGPEYFETLFASAITKADEHDAYLYCGEYGVIDNADPQATVRWLRDINTVFEKHGIGRALWIYKEMDFGLTLPHYDSVRAEILEVLTRP